MFGLINRRETRTSGGAHVVLANLASRFVVGSPSLYRDSPHGPYVHSRCTVQEGWVPDEPRRTIFLATSGHGGVDRVMTNLVAPCDSVVMVLAGDRDCRLPRESVPSPRFWTGDVGGGPGPQGGLPCPF